MTRRPTNLRSLATWISSLLALAGLAHSQQSAVEAPTALRGADSGRPASGSSAPVDAAAFRSAVMEAHAAMDAGQYQAAESAYARAVAADPSHSRAQFNLGVAQYKSGNLESASESFAAAANTSDELLATYAMFNQGNAIYAQALKKLGQAAADPSKPIDPAQTPQSPDLAAAIEVVKKALTHFKDSARADPTDVDPRVNAETATRLLKNLEELQKQQQEQEQKKQEQEQKQQEQEQEQKGQEQKEQQQKEQQKQEQGKQDQQQEQQQPSDGQDSQQQGKPQDDQQHEQTPEPKPSDSGNPSPDEAKKQADAQGGSAKKEEGQPDAAEAPAAGDPVKGAPLSKNEAEKLLQAVRDREKARREAKDAAEQVKRTPTSKDW